MISRKILKKINSQKKIFIIGRGPSSRFFFPDNSKFSIGININKVNNSKLNFNYTKTKLIQENDIKVEESEVKDKAKEMIAANFKQFGQEVPAEELDNYAATVLAKQEERQKMYNELYSDKILDLVSSKCKLESKEITYDEFVKLAAKK